MTQRSDIAACEASFIPDRFAGVRGLSVDRRWLEDLQRIDSRLVLRWQPNWGHYAVFMQMSNGRLWSQPVHMIRGENGRPRTPDNRDLEAIRKAHWLAERGGARLQILQLHQHLAARDKLDSAHREKVLREACRDAARRSNLTMGAIKEVAGVTRKPVRSAGGR